jgi:hypothetical protein
MTVVWSPVGGRFLISLAKTDTGATNLLWIVLLVSYDIKFMNMGYHWKNPVMTEKTAPIDSTQYYAKSGEIFPRNKKG